MKVRIINADEVDLADMKAHLQADLMFMYLMKQPPEIRAALYKRFMESDSDDTTA